MKKIKTTSYNKWCREQDKKFPPPRELCTHCMEWLYQEDAGFNDIPHCSMAADYDTRHYMDGYTDKCPRFMDF